MTGSDANLEKPLAGKCVVVTRARPQAENLIRHIEEAGGEAIEFPTIEICPPESFTAIDAAVDHMDSYDWLMFTSVNSVEPFVARLKKKGKTTAVLAALNIAAIGPETAKRLDDLGIRCSIIPQRYQAEGILEAISPEKIRGKRVLIPRAAEAREVLPETLRKWGAVVDVVVAYRTVVPPMEWRHLAELLAGGRIDVITFTSSSTVRNFADILKSENIGEIIGNCAIACIGPITAATVEALGGRPTIVAQEFTIPGMMRAIVDYFRAKSRAAGNITVASQEG